MFSVLRTSVEEFFFNFNFGEKSSNFSFLRKRENSRTYVLKNLKTNKLKTT